MERSLLERRDGWGDPDVLAFLQPPLTFDQVVHTVDHQLHQFHLCKHRNTSQGSHGYLGYDEQRRLFKG